jgi:hypothetical protein
MAIQQAEAHSPHFSSTPGYDKGVLQFIDHEARQGPTTRHYYVDVPNLEASNYKPSEKHMSIDPTFKE